MHWLHEWVESSWVELSCQCVFICNDFVAVCAAAATATAAATTNNAFLIKRHNHMPLLCFAFIQNGMRLDWMNDCSDGWMEVWSAFLYVGVDGILEK